MNIFADRSRFIALVALALSILYFFSISVNAALDRRPIDFETLYGGAKVFVFGGDPYSSEDISLAMGWPMGSEVVQITLPALFPVLAPFAAIPMETSTARDIWLWFSVISIFASLLILPKLGRIGKLSDPPVILLLSACLLLGSFRSVLWLANTDIFALFFVLLGLFLAFSDRTKFAAFALIVAMCLKIQSVGLFAIYLYFRGHRKLSVLAIGGWLGVNLFAMTILSVTSPEWLENWRISWTSDSSILDNSLDPRNPGIYMFTHLRAGLAAFTGEVNISGFVAILVCLVLLWVVLFNQTRAHAKVRTPEDGQLLLLELAIVALVGLLIVYHRASGAVFLVLPIAWVISSWILHRNRIQAALVAVGCISIGLFNTQFIYNSWVLAEKIPSWFADSRFGQVFGTYHAVWIQLAMLLILVYVHTQSRRYSVTRTRI